MKKKDVLIVIATVFTLLLVAAIVVNFMFWAWVNQTEPF